MHPTCAGFLARIVETGVSVVTSDLLRVELVEAAFSIALKERWGGQWRSHRSDGRARRRGGRHLRDAVARYEKLLTSVDHIPVPVGRVVDRATTMMIDYGLASYDSVHAASAIMAGAKAIVTTDTGFALIPTPMLTIYTDRSRLATCRGKRQR